MFETCKTFQHTPLHLAAQSGNVEVIKYLEDEGIRFDEKDNGGVWVCC